jgi:outer membrane protein assembly factor BamD
MPMRLRPFPAAAWRRARSLPLVVGLAALLLAGCAGKGTDDQVPEQPPEELYNKAQQLLNEGNYREAAPAFEEVERQHPYSQWATRGQMMAAYAFYESNQYDEAVAAAQRFIDLHPGNADVPYAYYLVGMCYYEQISDIGRDQEMTQNALNSFNELIRRYPGSDYATDAKLKVDLVRDHLAGKEMEVGRFYQRRKLWLAGINRFQTVVEQYQTTTHVPEALHRLTESYLALGMTREAQASAAVLGYNFPGSEWYERSYALLRGQNLEPSKGDDGSWLSRLF